MDLNYHLIGLRIRHFRTERNMSQEELGDLVGTTNRHIINIENGNKGPSLTLLVAIANALNVTSDDLLLDNLKRYGTLSDNELLSFMLDCNKTEKAIITKAMKSLRHSSRSTESKLKQNCPHRQQSIQIRSWVLLLSTWAVYYIICIAFLIVEFQLQIAFHDELN